MLCCRKRIILGVCCPPIQIERIERRVVEVEKIILWSADAFFFSIHLSDWFRDKTAPDSFEPTVDMLLNMAAFIYLGAACPWESLSHYSHGNVESHFPVWRLILLSVAILTLRRIPVVMSLYKTGLLSPNVSRLKEAFFMGFFGPIGVSAIFYLHIALEFLRKHVGEEGNLREDTKRLFHMIQSCVWFIVLSSVVSFPIVPSGQILLQASVLIRSKTVHGLAIFAYQIFYVFRSHTKPSTHEEQDRYSFSGFVRREKDWIARMRKEEEHIIKELTSGERPKRPRPAFRRVKMEDHEEP